MSSRGIAANAGRLGKAPSLFLLIGGGIWIFAGQLAAETLPAHVTVHDIPAGLHDSVPLPTPAPLPTPLPDQTSAKMDEPEESPAPAPVQLHFPDEPTPDHEAVTTPGQSPEFLETDPMPMTPGSLTVNAPIEVPPAPTPEPSLYDPSLTMPLFYAIADRDYNRLGELLNSRADPDAVLPDPPPEDFTTRFPDGNLAYYVRREHGFTALMLASGMGDETSVQFLLLAGADKNKLSRRHKTFALYQAAREGHLEVMRLLMGITPESPANRYRVRVNLAAQTATLWEGNEIAIETPISSGKKGKPTPVGRYLVTNKYRHWKSTIYDSSMPYFLRLSCSDFGLHAGRLPGYPASSGCIRLPEKNAREFFAKLPIGTLVEIE